MKSKLIYSNYNEETGLSDVTILTNLGEFSAQAKLNKEDAKYESNFAGCNIAEARAKQKYYKSKIKNIKEQIKGLHHLENVLKNMKGYNSKSIENRKLRHQIYIKQNEVISLEKRIEYLNQKIDEYLEQRVSFLKSKNLEK